MEPLKSAPKVKLLKKSSNTVDRKKLDFLSFSISMKTVEMQHFEVTPSLWKRGEIQILKIFENAPSQWKWKAMEKNIAFQKHCHSVSTQTSKKSNLSESTRFSIDFHHLTIYM